jgi:3-oxoacyl-[acyl-carrier protein] reductase
MGMTKLLFGKTAIVTGGTSGIGKAIALRFAEQGAKVAIFGQNHERGAEVVEKLRESTESALFLPVDVSKQQEVDKACGEVIEVFGKVDILVNNAGITRDNLLLKMSEKDWDEVMAINVKSCYNVCHALVRPMVRARGGAIINMSSVVGLTGNAGQMNYAASKAAVIGLTKALAKELASRNIRVNCIAPGFIQTAMTEGLKSEELLRAIPLGRLGTPEEVADMALFLASDLSTYVTGQVLSVDGGMAT